MKKLIYIIIIFTSAYSAILSQGGSNYSVNGLGDFNSSVSAAYNGLGGSQIAVPSDYSINMRNPAMWTYVVTTRLQAGYQFNQSIAENESIVLKQNNGKVSGVLGLFSIDTINNISVSFGVHPYTNVNYYLQSPFSFKIEGLDFSGRSTYKGEGGMSLAYVGAAMKVYKGLSAGGEVFGSFGSVNYISTTEVFGDNHYPGTNRKFDQFYGLGFKGGLSYEFPFGLYLGLCTEYHSSLKYDRQVTYYSQTMSDSITKSVNDIEMPPAIGGGLAYKTGKFLFAVDYTMQDFSNLAYQPASEVTYGSNSSFSFGISRLGSRTLSAKFADKVTYNLGFGYKNLYYAVKGVQINDIFASVGADFPVFGGTMMNAALQLGMRGTKDNGLIRENYFRMTIDISIGDSWFKPFKREFE